MFKVISNIKLNYHELIFYLIKIKIYSILKMKS